MSAESLTCQAWEALVLNVLQGRKTNHHQEPVSSKKQRRKRADMILVPTHIQS